MPKVLIKEYENPIASIPASDNFAVVVPGYLGTPKNGYDKKDLLIDYDVYELKSQADFTNYIGKVGGIQLEDGKAPEVIEINPNGDNYYSRYHRNLAVVDFIREDSSVYEIKELDETHEKYGKNGYLLKTFSWEESNEIYEIDGDGKTVLDEDGNPVVDRIEIVKKQVTVEFKKINSTSEVEFILDEATNLQITKSNMYCLVKNGDKCEGEDKIEVKQIGNQIAYELLGLGYTVLYKVLDVNKSIESQLCEDDDFWEPLKDKSVFNFRYIMTGGYYNVAAMNQIIKLTNCINSNVDLNTSETLVGQSNGRGDCIALCDIDEDTYGISSSIPMKKLAENFGTAAGLITESPYAAIFAPRVEYSMDEKTVEPFNGNKIFPASFHYLACAARAFERYNEWYAVAGYARGISKYDVANTSVKVGEILVNTLAPRESNKYASRAINFVLHERGNYYLWGNRTSKKIESGLGFHHFLNIRQLCCSIKKQLYAACRQFTFDPNSDLLWINFVNAIKPTLEAMKADQGIKGYTIFKVENVAKAVLTAKIRIVPVEAVEDFDISIYLEDTLTGINVTADEEQA